MVKPLDPETAGTSRMDTLVGYILLGGVLATVLVGPWAGAICIALVLFVAGRWVFRRLSPHFEDFV